MLPNLSMRTTAIQRNLLQLSLLGLLTLLTACGGGSGGSAVTSGAASGGTAIVPINYAAQHCAAPRPAATINPDTGAPYGDVQGSLSDELHWIASFVNQNYLWYADVPVVSPAPYVIGGNVPYVNPANNSTSSQTLTSNTDVVDAYFNSQRSPLLTASGKPKDQFHFTYTTTDWHSLSQSGNQTGFGFEAALISASAPRLVLVAYTEPNTPATQNGLQRGTQFISVNGVDVANGADIVTLNTGLFNPVPGTSTTFVVRDPGSTTTRTVTMTAATVALSPVQNVQTLPAPNNTVGYFLYTDQIATAEAELIAALTQLQAANGGLGISDLVLDLRYNGGGYLDLASELAYMIAGPGPTTGKIFSRDTYNDKNPFGLSASQTVIPFHNTTQGFSSTTGQPLPNLGLSRVFVITGAGTCSASEAIINGLIGVGVQVIQIGATTCGKPYGFYPQDNCSTTYFTVEFQGVNNQGFGAYADGFIPGGSGSTANNLPGCAVSDDFTQALGNVSEARLAAALTYRNSGSCPVSAVVLEARHQALEPLLVRSAARQNNILRLAH